MKNIEHTKRKPGKILKKISITLLSIVLALLLFISNLQGSMLTTVALEQEARCGIEEHVHADSCFKNDILICEIPAHVHDTNCYMVLLAENDINYLLEEIDKNEDKSLESIITGLTEENAETEDTKENSVESDDTLSEENPETPPDDSGKENSEGNTEDNPDVTPDDTPEESPDELPNITPDENPEELTEDLPDVTPDEIPEELPENLPNESFEETPEENVNEIVPEKSTGIILNANLNTKDDALTLEEQYDLKNTIINNNEAALLSVGDSASGNNYRANFYVYLDGSWQCIGTLTFTTPWTNNAYAATLSTEDVMDLINESLGTSFTRSSVSLHYASRLSATNYTAATVSATSVILGTASRINSIRGAKYVRVTTPGQNGNSTQLRFYTVTLNYPDGTSEKKYIQSGTSILLPEDYKWKDGVGNEYNGGDSVNIASITQFTAYDSSRVTLEYNISFPTISGVTVDTKPTVDGKSSTSEVIDEFNSATVKRVSEENVIGEAGGGHAQNKRIIHFDGWKITGTETILLPNTVLEWETLTEYATNGKIQLTALWSYEAEKTCLFFVKYDSVASTEGQDVTAYTPCIFTSYIEGIDTSLSHTQLDQLYGVNIEAVTDEEVLEVDGKVRAKYGANADGVYLTSFPSDEYIFQQLKQYASQLTVDGVRVSVDDLNENGYAIRWYVFKCQDDAWHIDGKLVRKHGMMNIHKTFAGNKTAISLVKNNFFIEAVGSEKGTEYLTLDNYESYDASTDTYTWLVDDVAYGEVWNISERQYALDGYDVYSEYIITDASSEQAGSGVGSAVSVLGMTYATDIGEYEVLEVDFYNVYRDTESLVIKKEDSETGRALAGARFILYQNDQPLTFSYNNATQSYHYDKSGNTTELSCDANGFMEVSIHGISYDDGNITVAESVVPTGYAGSGNVTLGYTPNGNIGILNNSDARFSDNLLVIPNTSNTITVTVKKNWLCPEYAYEDVEVQLFANGRIVSALFPSVMPTVKLTAANGYEYTWSNLAAYANGDEIEWSIRETKIGSENCRSDYSFVNWLVYYQAPQYTYDDEGYVESVLIPVANDIQKVVLRITKTNMNKQKALSGAIFSLVRVDDTLRPDDGFTPITLTTNGSGEAIFSDLAYGTYAITELVAPKGYEPITEPVYVTINADNTISVSDNFYIEIDQSSSLSVIIRNSEPIPIPQTGGPGLLTIYSISLVLMAFAIYIYTSGKIKNKKFIKGERQ